jgi:chromosome segregation ATPase
VFVIKGLERVRDNASLPEEVRSDAVYLLQHLDPEKDNVSKGLLWMEARMQDHVKKWELASQGLIAQLNLQIGSNKTAIRRNQKDYTYWKLQQPILQSTLESQRASLQDRRRQLGNLESQLNAVQSRMKDIERQYCQLK